MSKNARSLFITYKLKFLVSWQKSETIAALKDKHNGVLNQAKLTKVKEWDSV